MENRMLGNSQCFETPLLPLLQSFNTQFNHSFHDSEQQFDEDRCYLMEIQQLKRQNTFLKKKIAEINKKSQPSTSKRKSLPSHVKPNISIVSQSQQNYIISFLNEVVGLLQSFGEFFKLSLQSNIRQQIKNQEGALRDLTHNNAQYLNKQLERLLLQPQQNKYKSLISIFSTYYQQNTHKQQQMRNKVEQLTTQLIQIGKRMAQNIKNREKIKGSRILSIRNESGRNDSFSTMKESFIKSTWTQSELDLTHCKLMLGKQRLLQNIF